MKNFNSLRDIDTNTDEGKMLLAALSVLTSIETPDKRYGGMTHPDDVLKRVENLTRYIYEDRTNDIEKDIYNKNILRHKFL
jgi:hypothetical protein